MAYKNLLEMIKEKWKNQEIRVHIFSKCCSNFDLPVKIHQEQDGNSVADFLSKTLELLGVSIRIEF